MSRILPALFLFIFSCALLLAQTGPELKNLKMDRMVLKTGKVFNGLFIEKDVKSIFFKSIEQKPDGTLRIFDEAPDQLDVESLALVSPKDRAMLEKKIKELKELPKPNLGNLQENFDVELVPQVGVLEPTRIRGCIHPITKRKMTFFISPNTNQVFISPSEEKSYLALKKGIQIQGNDLIGNVTDAAYYEKEIVTASDTGHLTSWNEKGIPGKNIKVLQKSIRQITPLSESLLIIDEDWQFHNLENQEAKPFEKYELPLVNLMEKSKLLVAKHGSNQLSIWSKKTGKKVFSKKLNSPFDYLICNNENHLLIKFDEAMEVYQIKTNRLVKSYPIDLDSYSAFVDVAQMSSIDGSIDFPVSAVLFHFNDVSRYLNLENDPNSKSVIVEVMKLYPGITKINYKQGNPFEQVNIRPLAQWNHFHASIVPQGNKMDFEQPYKYTIIPSEITPATTTILLDNKVAYCSGDKYFHLLCGFRNNFKLERGEYFHIGNVCINNKGTRVAHTAHKSFIYVYDAEKKAKTHTLEADSPPLTLALSGDGNVLLSCHEGGKITQWDLTTGKEKSQMNIGYKPIKALLNFDGTRALLHCEGNRAFALPTNVNISLQAIGDAENINTIPLERGKVAYSLPAFTWNPTWRPKFLDNDLKTRKKIEEAFDPDKNKGKGFYGVKDNQDQIVSMTEDGKKAITLLDKNNVAIWDLENAKKLHVLEHQDPVSCLKISSNGRWVLTGNEKYQAFLFDGITGEKLKTLDEHYGPIYSVGFFKNEKYACVGCKYGVLFWDIEKGIFSHTLITLGGVLFFDSNGNYDCDHRARDYIAFRDKKTNEIITSWKFNQSGGTLNPFQKMLRGKNKPGMLKEFLGTDDVNFLLDPKK